MADTTVRREAYYAKEQIRMLKIKLTAYRDSLKACANPKRRMWLEARIDELRTALHERTAMWY